MLRRHAWIGLLLAATRCAAFVLRPGVGTTRSLARGSYGRRERLVALAEDSEDSGAYVPPTISEDEIATTKDFFLEVSARFNGSDITDILFDKKVYTELRRRRDFGLEQELYAVLQSKRNASAALLTSDYIDPLTGKRNMTAVLPNPERTPNDVIMAVLESLRENDEPYENHGVEVFYRFTSPSSATYEYEIDRVASFIKSSKYQVMTRWDAVNYPRPLDLSLDHKRAYQLLRLRDSKDDAWRVVSFSLSQHRSCWLIDSVIVKGL
ncbi:unnamed protein product [Phaeothamnion confervicola]